MMGYIGEALAILAVGFAVIGFFPRLAKPHHDKPLSQHEAGR